MGAIASVGSLQHIARWGNQQKLDRCQNGTQWALRHQRYSDLNMALHRSTDLGGSWQQQNTLAYGGNQGTEYVADGELRTDLDDYMHLVWRDAQDGKLYYRRGVPVNSGAGYTFDAPKLTILNSSGYGRATMRVHREGTGWAVHIVFTNTSGTPAIYYTRLGIAADGTTTVQADAQVVASGQGGSQVIRPSITLRSTGDEKTVSGQPDLFIAWAGPSGVGVRCVKLTYSAGSWAFGTITTIVSNFDGAGDQYSCDALWDGTRWLVVGLAIRPSDSITFAYIYERDLADTTTTTRLLTSADAQAVYYGGATLDGQGNVYRFGMDGNVTSVLFCKWTRATLTAEAPVVLDNSVPNTHVSVRRGAAGGGLDAVYLDSPTQPYVLTSVRYALNQAPNTATAQSPVGNTKVDRTQPTPCAWTFTDPDSGDTQSRADFRYRVGTGAWTTITNAATTVSSYSIPANTFTAGQNPEWAVLPYDSQGVPAPAWSAGAFFIASDPTAAPTITAPVAGGTIATSSYTVTWSASAQDAYQVRRVADGAGQAPDPGTVYATTDVIEDAAARSRTLTFDTNNRVEHVQVRVRSGGLWSPWADVRATVSYTPPATPLLALAAVKTRPEYGGTDAIDVTITNPAPTGNQPTVTSHDVWVDDGTGEGLRRVVAGIAAGGVWRHTTPAAGRDYLLGRIRVVAIAANGTTSTASS